MAKKPKWLGEPEEHDYPAGESYLSLEYPVAVARQLVKRLRAADMSRFLAKDIMRASRLPLLATSDADVARDLEKVRRGESLSPVLLVQTPGRLVVADGYHRVCAVYHLDPDAAVPGKRVELKS